MNSGLFFKKIISSSAFLAVIPAILFLLFLDPLGLKFTTTFEEADKFSGQIVYTDLNSDSVSEIVHSSKGLPYYFIAVRDNSLRFHDQWNLKDSMDASISQFFFGNYDNDLYKEIYVFTHNKDSLFLNVNEILEPKGRKTERIFITKIGYLNGKVLSTLYPAGFFDLNADGNEDVYFSISSAFGFGPRKVYAYDLVKRRLYSSQLTGTICIYPKVVDVDGDMLPEIYGTMSASGNNKRTVPYSDSSTWFMVFNYRLKFKFPPVEFPGFVNSLEINAYENGNFKGYLLNHSKGGTDTTVLKSQIMLFSTKGKLLRSRLISEYGNSEKINLFVQKSPKSDRIYIFGEKIFEIDDRLDIINSVDLPFKTKTFPYQIDVDGDGKDEFLIYSEREKKLVIFNSDLNKISALNFKAFDTNWKFSHFYSSDHAHKLFLRSGPESYFFDMKRNRYYYLGYMAYPGIYFLSFLFIFLVKKLNTYQVIQKESLKQRLITLQLQGIKAQLDPHFTFNTLNSVASLIYLDDRLTAYDHMNKFTQLLRIMINDAERIYRSLGEELDFVTIYLDLEKMRFGDKFIYEIIIGEGVNQKEQVPKLVLQTFAENSIKHGIMPRSEGGKLIIKAEKVNVYLKLTIEDNGIGRSKAAGLSTSTGKGIRLTREFYNILNQINKRPISHLITDLYNDEGESAGTRVEVWVPD